MVMENENNYGVLIVCVLYIYIYNMPISNSMRFQYLHCLTHYVNFIKLLVKRALYCHAIITTHNNLPAKAKYNNKYIKQNRIKLYYYHFSFIISIRSYYLGCPQDKVFENHMYNGKLLFIVYMDLSLRNFIQH